jgi:ABC-type sugar transport system ATPase subunit
VSFDLYRARSLHHRTDRVQAHRAGADAFGSDRFDGGTLEVEGQPATFRTPPAIARGIGFVPEDRHREGLMLNMSVTENLAMAMLGRFRRGFLLSRGRMVDAGRRAISILSIQPPDGNGRGAVVGW